MQALRYLTMTIVAVLLSLGVPSNLTWAQSTATDQAILRYQRLLQRHSRDATVYYRLGDAYMQKARETGDITYINLAEKSLQQCLEIAPEHSGAARHLAYAMYMRHGFDEAAVQAQKAAALDPTDSHAYGILGDAYLEVGKYEAAAHAYQRMIQLQGDLYAYSRLSGLKSLQGDTDGAIADLERAIQLGQAQERPAESIAWAMWQLGNEAFALGKLPAAEASYLDALKTFPDYYRALAGLAQVRAAQQRYPEAIDLYRKAIAIVPLPDYAAALGDVYTKLGRPEDAQKPYDLVAYIGYLNTLNKVLYNRELAYFYADHDRKLPEALELARRELEVRRDIYAYDVLAWALYKHDQPQEALTAITAALQLGTKDARLFFHAGMIHHCLGDHDKARDYLQRALATNPYFHVLHVAVAERTLQAIERQLDTAVIQEKTDDR
ncbi:MAG: tetratricopeptide repeat protein [Candidatus Entotheonellia bacterium]